MKSYLMRFIYAFLFMLLLISCTKDDTRDGLNEDKIEIENVVTFSSDQEPTFTIHLNREHQFTDTEEVYFSYIGDVAVDDSGRVLITEMSMGNRAIHQFNSDGAYLGQLGREGRGPGEYQTPTHLQIVNDKAFIYDNLLKRITAYSLNDLSVIRSVPVSAGEYLNSRETGGLSTQRLFVHSNEDFTVGFGSLSPNTEKNYIRYFRADPEGTFNPDQLFKLKAKNVFSVDEGSISLQALLPFDHDSFIYYRNNNFYTLWSEQFLIKIYSENGNLERGIYYPVEKVPFMRNDYVENHMSPHLKRAAQYIDFPEYWPVLDDLLVDDQGRIWIAVVTDERDRYEWWVLENSGELMARFEWPRFKKIQNIKNGFLYTLERDPSVGSQEVIKYRIEFEEL